VANVAATDFQVKCAWCQAIIHPGHPTGPDQISHGMCCPCKAKYFPAMDGDSGAECEFDLVEREHEIDDQPVSHNPFTDTIRYQTYSYHIDREKCVHCGMERTLDPEPCDCGPDDDGPDRSDE